jgi:hypothetical protein
MLFKGQENKVKAYIENEISRLEMGDMSSSCSDGKSSNCKRWEEINQRIKYIFLVMS